MLNIALNLSSANLFLKTPNLTRQILKNPNLKKSFKRAGLEGLQEAGEETINLIAEKQALADNYSFEDAINDVATKEGLESALLGFIGGAGQTGLTLAGRELKFKRNNEGKRVSSNDLLKRRVATQSELNSRWEQIPKQDKISSVTDAYLNAQEQTILREEYQKAVENNDIQKQNDIANKTFLNQSYQAFQSGTTDNYINMYESISKLSEEEAESKNLPKDYKEKSEKIVDTINQLEDEYIKASAFVNKEEVFLNQANLVTLREEGKELDNAIIQAEKEYQTDLEDFNIEEGKR